MPKKITGFTLAEVLITLAIIGVVAALTIPSLMQSTQDAELKTAWKKAYSEINQATLKIMLDNGGDFKGMTVVGDASEWIRDVYGNYMKYGTKCTNDDAIAKGCWSTANKDINGGTVSALTVANDAGAVVTNGIFIHFVGGDTNAYHSNCDMGTNANVCSEIIVDVNGFKGPNTIGKDIFGLFVYANKIEPYTATQNPFGLGSAFAGWNNSVEYLKN